MTKEEFDVIMKMANEAVEPLRLANEKSKEFARWMATKKFKQEEFTKEQLEMIDKLEDEVNDLEDTMFDID